MPWERWAKPSLPMGSLDLAPAKPVLPAHPHLWDWPGDMPGDPDSRERDTSGGPELRVGVLQP